MSTSLDYSRAETVRDGLPGVGRGQTWGVRGVGQSIWQASVSPKHKLGDRLVLGSRTFYYTKARGDLVAGTLNVFDPDVIEEDDVTVAHAIGTTKITVTASDNMAVDQFAEGMLVVCSGGDADGDQYVIKSHPAIASAATGVVSLYEPGLVTAWTTIANIDIILYTNLFYGVEQLPAGSGAVPAKAPAGVTLIDVAYATAPYVWMQTYGPCAVLMDESLGDSTADQWVSMGPDVAGSVQTQDTVGEPIVGFAPLQGINDDAHWNLVVLTILR